MSKDKGLFWRTTGAPVNAEAARRATIRLWWVAGLTQTGIAIGLVVSTAWGIRFPLPLWLVVIAGVAGAAGNALLPAGHKATGYLMLASLALLATAAVILIVKGP